MKLHRLQGSALALMLATGLVAQTPTYLDPDDPNPSRGNQGIVKTLYMGPFSVPAARVVNGQLIPGEYEQNVNNVANPGTGWVTGYDNRIVDTNYLPVDQFAPEGGSDFYLHHAVFVNRSVSDLTCQFMPGERFAASGGERMPFVIPNGYGYPINASDRFTALMHIQNFTAQSRQVYLEYSFTMQDLAEPYVAVRPWWLDVVWCTSSYNVPTGTGLHVRQRDYSASRAMTLLSLGPHLHCGGSKLELINKATGQPIWTFTNDPTACPTVMETAMPSVGVPVPVGTTVTIKSTYQQSASTTIDAMGIVLCYVLR